MSFEKPNYLDQWKRTLRWYKRLKDICSGIQHDKPQQFYQDEIRAFFDSCYHLKHWLEKSGKPSPSFTGLNANVSDNMKICRDICNGDKHLVLNETAFDKNTNFSRKDVTIVIGSPHIIKEKYYVRSGGKDISVEKVAEECIKEWRSFLKLNKLLN